jgi:hypothetical protein
MLSVPPSFLHTPQNDNHVKEKIWNAKSWVINFLFELKPVKETALTLDKANFYRAGWYLFELFNDEKLVERHKFYLSKEF